MNSLSWLIYWADAAPSVSTFVCIISFFLFIASFVGTIFFICSRGSYRACLALDEAVAAWNTLPDEAKSKTDMPGRYNDNYTLSSGDRSLASFSPTLRIFPWLMPVFFLLWGGAFLVPEKDTFYLIAASEAGEQAVQTPEFTKVRQVLNKWLDDQTAPTSNVTVEAE